MVIPRSNGKMVLVTGINGFIASVLGQHLLSKGYSLRGTARRLASTESLLKGPYAPYQDRVTMYEVPDMTVSGVFDEAAAGVHGIFHVASPVNFSFVTFEQTIFPAVKGSENVLESALKAGPQLASVVFTSSMGAIIDPTDEPNHVFTENHFAAAALNRAIADRDAGRSTPGSIMYAASKTAAERTVWAFRDSHKPPFAITAIHPSVVIGPPVFLPSTGAEVSETILPIFNILSGIAKTIRPNIGSGSFVNVRDVAFIHSWAFEHPEVADGERYIACEGFGPMQATADILRWKYRETEFAGRITVGEPGTGYVGYDAETGEVRSVGYVPGKPRVSGEKAARAMGVRYISYRKSVEDTAEVLQALL